VKRALQKMGCDTKTIPCTYVPGCKVSLICLVFCSCGLKLMVCSFCGRTCVETSCAGCKAISRIRSLWAGQAGNDPRALTSLRNCVGELSDLIEAAGVLPAGGQPAGTAPEKREPPLKGDKKERKTKEGEGGGSVTTPRVPLKEEPREERSREASLPPAGDTGEDDEESEESSDLAEDEEVSEKGRSKEKEPTKRELERAANAAKLSKHGLTQQLGLRVLPVKLSVQAQDGGVPEPVREGRGEAASSEVPSTSGRERRESDRRVPEGGERSKKEARPREPPYPPPGRGEKRKEERRRSRTPHRKRKSRGANKGIKKRERGRAWRDEQRKAGHEKQWRRR